MLPALTKIRAMRIRTRILIVLAAVIGMGIVADWAIYRKVILPSYAALEREEARADMYADGDPDMLHTFTTFPGVSGAPALLARTDRWRRIAHQGRSAALVATGSVALAGLALLGAMMALLGRLVVRPLDALKNRAIAIRESGDSSLRLGSARTDEIGQLSGEFDHLLDRNQEVTRGLEAQVKARTAELRQANEQLEQRVVERTARTRQVERRLRHLVANSPAVIYSIRPSGDHGATFITENVRELLGYEAHEVLGDPEFWNRHVHPDDERRVRAAASGILAAGSVLSEYRLRHKDGSWRGVRDDMRLVRDDDGRPQEIVGSWLDVTDSQEAEERAHIFHQALEATLDPVLITDMQAKVVYANPAAAAAYGGTVGDFIGHPVDAFHEDRTRFAEVITPAIQAHGGWTGEVRARHKDGTMATGLLSLTVIRPAGGPPLGVVGIFRDITERKEAEEALQQRERQLRQALEEHQARLRECCGGTAEGSREGAAPEADPCPPPS